MMKNNNHKLTLDQPVTYQIRVPGNLDEVWLDCYGAIAIELSVDENDSPVTTLIGTFDQAALIGLLRRLYSLGLPLISVTHLEALNINPKLNDRRNR
jgi:hypothetical protein